MWHVLGPLTTFINACVRARLCVCQNEGECLREKGGGTIHVLLIHSIFVVDFIFLFFFFTLRTVYVFWIRYKIDVISSNTYKSVIRMTQVFDLENGSISKTLLQVFKRENDLMQ